jgi:shikimate kinase
MTPLHRPLFLIGYRGSGKSTVARHLARLWGCVAADSDDAIEEASGRSIRELFEESESAFRELERRIVALMCVGGPMVASLGGGAILDPTTRARLREAGHVVWLTATPEVLAERLKADESSASRRPGLTPLGLVEEIEGVLAERTPLYRESADVEIDTVGKEPEEIAEEIARWWEERGGTEGQGTGRE